MELAKFNGVLLSGPYTVVSLEDARPRSKHLYHALVGSQSVLLPKLSFRASSWKSDYTTMPISPKDPAGPSPKQGNTLSTSSIPTLGTLLHEKCNVSMRPQIVFFAALQLRCKTIEVLALQGQMLWGSALQGLGRTGTLCH